MTYLDDQKEIARENAEHARQRAEAIDKFCQFVPTEQLERALEAGVGLKELVTFVGAVDAAPTIAGQARWDNLQKIAAHLSAPFLDNPDGEK